MMPATTDYIGDELELFAHAVNWKHYWGQKVKPYLGNHVLEVGAGMGTNTPFLLQSHKIFKRWVCLEPDEALALKAKKRLSEYPLVEVQNCYLSDFKTKEKFDSILYIDVIEHIEDDAKEIKLAKSFLKPGGHLIILVPAHQYLYSDFDKAIGHYRRYTKRMLKNTVGEDLKLEQLLYLDSVGITASVVNKLFLKQRYPTLKQVQFWDRNLVRLSKISDWILGYRFGKSLLGIWSN